MAHEYERVPVEKAQMPRVTLFSCADSGCAVEVSYPGDMLRWFDGVPMPPEDGEIAWTPDQVPAPGWYCTESCWSEITILAELLVEGEGLQWGPTLEAEILRRTEGGEGGRGKYVNGKEKGRLRAALRPTGGK